MTQYLVKGDRLLLPSYADRNLLFSIGWMEGHLATVAYSGSGRGRIVCSQGNKHPAQWMKMIKQPQWVHIDLRYVPEEISVIEVLVLGGLHDHGSLHISSIDKLEVDASDFYVLDNGDIRLNSLVRLGTVLAKFDFKTNHFGKSRIEQTTSIGELIRITGGWQFVPWIEHKPDYWKEK